MNTAINYTELLLPETQVNSSAKGRVGYLCRAALAYLCILGFSLFLNDALVLHLSQAFRLLVCTILILWFTVMGISKRFFIGGGVLGAGLLLFFLLRTENLVEKIYFGYTALYNAFFLRLYNIGYGGAGRNVINITYTLRRYNLTETDCRMYAYAAIMLVLAAVICLCILKRVRLFTLIAACAPICVLFLYYGMAETNLGFAIIMASLCGGVALTGYDHIYTRRKVVAETAGISAKTRDGRAEITYTIRRNSALGGFTGIATALLALILLLGPANMKNSMDDIPAVSVPMLKIENFFVALANGQDPDFSSLVFAGVASLDSRSTEAEKRSYTGSRVFELQLDTALPVYLRSWVGTDYYDDSWHAASYDRINEYKREFGENFTPEQLTYDLIGAINPSLTGLGENSGYKDHTELGYVTAAVNIRKLQPTANLIFMPSYTDHTLGLLAYGTREPSNVNYTTYFDGIYTSTSYLFMDDYAAVANLPLLRDSAFATNIAQLMEEYMRQKQAVLVMSQLLATTDNPETIDRIYARLASEPRPADSPAFIPTNERSLLYRYTYDMTEDERRQIEQIITLPQEYRDFVYNNYLTGCENFDAFQALARSIVYDDMPVYTDNDIYTTRNRIVMAIIDYLSAKMVYSLSPIGADAERDYVNAAETFLFDTNEGYCVQYATSAVMLLRSLGIPARYAEGYISGKYNRISGDNSAGSYATTITDRDAHAWIEVYYDYYGWIQYEATTPFYSDMYEPLITTSGEVLEFPEYNTPTENISEEIVSGPTEAVIRPTTKKGRIDWQIPTAVTAGLVLVAAALVLRIRSSRLTLRREKLLRSAAEVLPTADRRLETASKLNVRIYRLLSYNRLMPGAGEQRSAFSERVDTKLGKISSRDFTRISENMNAGEFGTDITSSRLSEVSAYYEDLIRYTLRVANPLRRLWLNYLYIC